MSHNTNTDILIAGAFAAFTVDLLVYPLDTLKTRIQSPDFQKLYTDAGVTNRRLLFRGLYQGVGSVILATIPSSGAFFTTYEAAKASLATTPLPQPLAHTLASSTAELVSCFILTPAEVLKQNAQMVSSGPSGAAATKQVLAQFRRHPTRLWNGYTALAARNLPFTGLQFPVFEGLKSYLLKKRGKQRRGGDDDDPSKYADDDVDSLIERTGITAVSAGLSGTLASFVTTPIDVVKTRIMLAAGDDGKQQQDSRNHGSGGLVDAQGRAESARSSTSSRNKSSIFKVFAEVYRTEGTAGLFRGGLLRSVWTFMGSGLYLGCYEGGRFYLERRRRQIESEELDAYTIGNTKI